MIKKTVKSHLLSHTSINRCEKNRFNFFIACIIFLFSSEIVLANDFSANKTIGCVPVSTFFTSNFSQAISYQWDFGDGTYSTIPNPGKVYNSVGNFSVTLTVTFQNGTTQTIVKSNYITSVALPKPNFGYSIIPGTCKDYETVYFQDSSSGNVVRWLWDFGDGNLSSIKNPSHQYKSSKSYQVTLHTWNSDSCYATRVQTVVVQFLQNPKVNFSIQDSIFCTSGQKTNALAQTISGNINQFQWIFSGGIPVASGTSPTISFPQTGNFSIQLIGKDRNGCFDTISKSINVIIRSSQTNISPYSAAICSGNITTYSAIGPIKSMVWLFSDGDSLQGISINKNWSNVGTYSFQYRITDTNNCVYTKNSLQSITVEKPTSNVSIWANGCTAPYLIQTSAIMGSGMSTKFWLTDSAGNRIDSSLSASWTTSVSTKGKYSILVRTFSKDCFFDSIYPVVFSSGIIPSFISDVDSGCVPLSISFQNKSATDKLDSIISVSWDFGDGTLGLGINPSHSYISKGIYPVSIRITTKNGCVDSLKIPNKIYAGNRPKAFFISPDTSGCKTIVRRYQDQSSGTITSWFWNFNNGTTSLLQNPDKPVNYSNSGIYATTLVVRDLGCSDTFQLNNNVTVYPPKPQFITPQPIGCDLPFTPIFQNTTVDGIRFNWNFGDSLSSYNTDTSRNAFHTYHQYGSYDVTLIAVSSYGCADTIVKKSWIKIAKPAPFFVAKDSAGCAPYTALMINKSSPGSYAFYFGNSFSKTPGFTFTTPGKYSVKLVMTDSIGCIDSFEVADQIWVKGLTVDFQATPTIGCIPFQSSFVSLINPIAITHYLWNFGDSSTSSLDQPTHTFLQKRSYTIKLSVIDTNGCKSSNIKTNYIASNNPVAAFEAPTQSCLNAAISFSNMSVGSGLSAWWDFGDGITSTTWSPTHRYTTTGFFTVKMVVFHASGCSDTLIKYKAVEVIRHQTSVANGHIVGYCAPALIALHSSSSNAVTWNWDFGDGATSTLENPSHSYNNNGYFNVILVTSNFLGCSDTLKIDSMVHIVGPVASFSSSPIPNCAMGQTTFTNLSQNYSKSIWDFNDGIIDSVQNPKHIYFNPGIYNPVLIVSDSLGCSSTFSLKNKLPVYPKPNAHFNFSFLGSCSRNLLKLIPNDSSYSQYQWDFGDGSSSFNKSPSHIYSSTNQFTVGLIVVDSNGCNDTFNEPIQTIIYQRPTALFQASNQNLCLHTIADFKNLTVSPNDTSYLSNWDFGDTTTSINHNPQKTYLKSGVYSVKLLVTDRYGCQDSITRINYIHVRQEVNPKPLVINSASVINNLHTELKWNPILTDTNIIGYQIFKKPTHSTAPFQLCFQYTQHTDSSWVDSSPNFHIQSQTYLILSQNYCNDTTFADSTKTHSSIFLSSLTVPNKLFPSVHLTWSKYLIHQIDTQVVHYMIFRKSVNNPSFLKIAEVPGTVNEYIDSNVCVDSFTYFVQAELKNGYWPNSNFTNNRILKNNPIEVIDLVQSSVLERQDVLVHWKKTKLSTAKYYQVYQLDSGSNVFKLSVRLPITDTDYIDQRVQTSVHSYTYKISVIDECGLEYMSNEGKTILLNLKTDGYTTDLSWSPYMEWKNPVSYYKVERRNLQTFHFDSIAISNSFQFHDDPTNLNNPFNEYRITAVEQDGNKSYSCSNIVRMGPKSTLFVPNAFSPNNDLLNDVFRAEALNIQTFRLEVYNRWGERIFETDDFHQGWDGTYKDVQCQEGAYTYLINAVGFDRKEYHLSGLFRLIVAPK
jgi:gliding motility-associated-like protein